MQNKSMIITLMYVYLDVCISINIFCYKLIFCYVQYFKRMIIVINIFKLHIVVICVLTPLDFHEAVPNAWLKLWLQFLKFGYKKIQLAKMLAKEIFQPGEALHFEFPLLFQNFNIRTCSNSIHYPIIQQYYDFYFQNQNTDNIDVCYHPPLYTS